MTVSSAYIVDFTSVLRLFIRFLYFNLPQIFWGKVVYRGVYVNVGSVMFLVRYFGFT